MTKTLRYSFVSMLMLICGSAFAQSDVTFDFDADYKTLFPTITGESDSNGSTAGDITVVTTSTPVEGVTVTVTPAEEGNNTANRIWNSTPRLRMYSGTITIKAESNFKKLTMTVKTSGSKAKENTVNVGKLNFDNLGTTSGTIVWEGNANEVAMHIGGNTQFSKIVVSYDGATPESNDYEAALTDTQGNWTIENVVLPEGLTYVWTQSSSYGMKASAYVNNTNYAAESYLVSPALALQENSVLTFDHVQRYAAADPASQLTLWIGESNATEKTQLTIPTYTDGSDWTFRSSGNIDLSAYAGKTVKLYFRYTSNETNAATWEIKNVKVTNAKESGEGPTLKDPTNTPETAYTVSEAINIIDNRSEYDMTQKVYVQGYITNIEEVSTAYGNATYDIASETTSSTTLKIYRSYYLNGEKYTAEDQIKVGDLVVVYGQLTLYNNSTYEMTTGGQLYSITSQTSGIANVKVNKSFEGVMYNTAGQVVNKGYKGLVIMNGKKFVNK